MLPNRTPGKDMLPTEAAVGWHMLKNEKVTVASEANICFQTGKDMGEVTGVVTSPIVLPNWKDSFAGNTCAGEINDGSSAVAAGDG